MVGFRMVKGIFSILSHRICAAYTVLLSTQRKGGEREPLCIVPCHKQQMPQCCAHAATKNRSQVSDPCGAIACAAMQFSYDHLRSTDKHQYGL